MDLMLQPREKKMKMSSMSDDVVKSITCCLSTTMNHYVNDAQLLRCGGNACKKCVDGLKRFDSIHCRFCDKEHAYYGSLPNPHIRHLIETYMDDLKQKLFEELDGLSESATVERIIEQREMRFFNVEYEVDAHIETIITGLLQHREELMKEIEKIKTRYQKHLNYDELEAATAQLNSLKQSILATDYDAFIDSHIKKNESKAVLNKYMDALRRIKFEPNETLNKDLVGQLTPFSKEIEISEANGSCQFSAYLKTQKKLFISDTTGSAIFIYDVDTDGIVKFTHEEIKEPRVLCFGQNNRLFLSDSFEYVKILLFETFDGQLNYLRKFKLDDLEGDKKLTSMDVDLESNSIYLCHNSNVSIFNAETGRLIRNEEYKKADCIKVNKEFVYCARYLDFEYWKDDRDELREFTRSYNDDMNSIRIFNKHQPHWVRTIFFDTWLQPFGLHVDDNDNILTIAYEISKNLVISTNKYLHVINKENEIVQKIKIDCKLDMCDTFCAFDNKISIVKDKRIKIIEFDRPVF